MAYIKTEYKCGDIIEVEKRHNWKYGAPGKKRSERLLPTPEGVKTNNERQKKKKLRRLIYCNFTPDDYLLTLTYTQDSRQDPAETKEILHKFFNKLREAYKKNGETLKFIAVTEGNNEAIHHHIIINGGNWNIPKTVSEIWQYGHPNFKFLHETEKYEQLADYLLKEQKRKKYKQWYSCSRNLDKPIIKKTIEQSKTWKEEPKPKKGWYLDKATLYEGVDLFGYEYQSYTMRKLKEHKRKTAAINNIFIQPDTRGKVCKNQMCKKKEKRKKHI